MTAQRADARRNYSRILAAAEQEVAAHGVNASLEQIARTVGVGSATVRRHFPTRVALLQAVFRERIEALCDSARELTEAPDARAALLEWLVAVADYAIEARGLAAALVLDEPVERGHPNACTAKLAEAGDPLLERAVQAGTVAPGLTTADLLTLIVGILLATEHGPDQADTVRRLFGVVVAGLSPCG
ncbi:AcrR family transcriptional regulator [Kibdelosporangium banguiense]|uniref:AcrR family transcriptional regulator n=1 Tax=Kibdelosporangium banguiense TaxID=1365924 RepID=A0ABS4U1E9_9PSEU|nr:TetR/AcrR family transcriptional regulator [Kibdelosporangium banguiense]MBP2330020.1 AcrR family transcriptional regulator [Kibdelosporangium banguiense]